MQSEIDEDRRSTRIVCDLTSDLSHPGTFRCMSGDMSKKFPRHFQTIHAISVRICLCLSLCICLCLYMSDHLVVTAGHQTGKQAEKQASQHILRQTDGHTYRQAGTCQHITCPHASTCQPTHEHRACLHVLACCFVFFNHRVNYAIYTHRGSEHRMSNDHRNEPIITTRQHLVPP